MVHSFAVRLCSLLFSFVFISAAVSTAVAQEFYYDLPEGGLRHGRPIAVSPSGIILGVGSEYPTNDPRRWIYDGKETTYLRSDLKPQVINSRGQVAGWYKGKELFFLNPGDRHQRVPMLRGVNYANLLGLTDSGVMHLYGERTDPKTGKQKRAGYFSMAHDTDRWERAAIKGRAFSADNVLGALQGGAPGFALLSSNKLKELALNFIPTEVSSNGLVAGYRRAMITNPKNRRKKAQVRYPFFRNAQGEQLQVPVPQKLGSYTIRSINSSGHMIISFKRAYAPAKSAMYFYEPGGVMREVSTLAATIPSELQGFTAKAVIGVDDAGTIVGYGLRNVDFGGAKVTEVRGYLLKRK